MKFLKYEGRVLCLVEKEDATSTPPARVPKIDLLIIPRNHADTLRNSHVWEKLMESVSDKNVIWW